MSFTSYISNPLKSIFYVEKNLVIQFTFSGLKKLKVPNMSIFINKNGNIVLDNLKTYPNYSMYSSQQCYLWILFIYSQFQLHMSKFELRGFAYKMKKEYNLIVFKLGYSHLVYYPLSLNLMLSNKPLKKKRDNVTYYLYGHNKQNLGLESYLLSELKKINIYSGYGIRNASQRMFLKKGKVSSF